MARESECKRGGKIGHGQERARAREGEGKGGLGPERVRARESEGKRE